LVSIVGELTGLAGMIPGAIIAVGPAILVFVVVATAVVVLVPILGAIIWAILGPVGVLSSVAEFTCCPWLQFV
jgi:hypothetical protein